MMKPSFQTLAELTARKGPRIFNASVSSVNPNPRMYKYYWWIFTEHSPVEGMAFLTDPYRLNSFDFQQQLKYCKENNLSALIYNERLYRLDHSLPFDFSKLEQEGYNFAPSFDEGPDPVTAEGFK